MVDFNAKMSQEHFSGEKERIIFLVNNLDYMYQSLKELHLEKGVQDVVSLEKELNLSIERLI